MGDIDPARRRRPEPPSLDSWRAPISVLPPSARPRRRSREERSILRRLVLGLGRPTVFVLLAVVGVGLLLAMVLTIRALLPESVAGINPATALAEGGHTIVVQVRDDSQTVDFGDYSVETLSGRPPKKDHGQLASGAVQVVVGPDWIGQVHIHYAGHCERFGNFDVRNSTDLIGEAYGWQERTVHVDTPCD